MYRLTLCCKFSWIWIKSDADCCKLRDAQNGLLFRDSKVLCAWCHPTHHYCQEISERLLQKHKSISKSAQKIESKNSSYGTMPKFTGSGKKHISQQFPKILSQNKFKRWHIIVRWALVFYLSHRRFNKRCLYPALDGHDTNVETTEVQHLARGCKSKQRQNWSCVQEPADSHPESSGEAV